MNTNLQKHYRIIRSLTDLLDNKFDVLGIKFGIDPLLGIIPGLGDVISFALSIYLLLIAVQMSIPNKIVYKMLVNIVLDFLIGLIPILGDFTDFFYKSNARNLDLLDRHLAKNSPFNPRA